MTSLVDLEESATPLPVGLDEREKPVQPGSSVLDGNR